MAQEWCDNCAGEGVVRDRTTGEIADCPACKGFGRVQKKSVRIADAKWLAARLGARGVIIITVHGDDVAGASYGATRHDCDEMGKMMDEMLRAAGMFAEVMP